MNDNIESAERVSLVVEKSNYLVELAKRVRQHANYFKSAGEMDRMKDLDIVFEILKYIHTSGVSIGDVVEKQMKDEEFFSYEH